MKAFIRFFLFLPILITFGISNPSPVQGEEITVFGPQVFSKVKGKPRTETVSFNIPVNIEGTLIILNGGEENAPKKKRVRKGKISLNGQQIIPEKKDRGKDKDKDKDSDRNKKLKLKKKIAKLVVPVNLQQGTNTLSVKLKGRRGSLISARIIIDDLPPVAAFTANPQQGEAPLTVSFDATASIDPDDSIASYEWSYGDGSIGTGALTGHTYTTPGTFTVTLTVTDQFGLTSQSTTSITVIEPNLPPVASFTADPATGPAPLEVTFDASSSTDPNDFIVSYSWDFTGGETATGITTSHTFANPGTFTVTLTVADSFGLISQSSQTVVVEEPAPAIPGAIADAPSLDETLIADMSANTAFLYTGPNAVQTGMIPGTIEAVRAAVVRGQVFTRDGNPLPGVTVTVKDRPEFGQTISRADGFYDLAVNGGSQLVLDYSLIGYLPGQRSIDVPWQDFSVVNDIALVPLDTQSTLVDLANATQPTLAQGSPVTDADGTRQAAVLFPQGTTAEMVLPNGSTQPLSSMTVRATEYTVGDNGPMAMPAELPPSSGYTYAVDLTVDEALVAGASSVNFNQSVPAYVDNFLGFPAGTIVPSGFYDAAQAKWVPSESGLVIDILGITGGLADLDVDGSATPASSTQLAALGITNSERQILASQFGSNFSLWRVPVSHFTTYDWNWSVKKGPDNAVEPDVEVAKTEQHLPDKCTICEGSVIQAEAQVLGQAIPISGTPFTMHYNSDRTPGYITSIDIPLVGNDPLPGSLLRIDLEVKIAGRKFDFSYPAIDALPGLTQTITWDGLDAYGRRATGQTNANIKISYVFPTQYQGTNAFAEFGDGTDLPSARTVATRPLEYQVPILLSDFRALGLGGWTLDQHHVYDPFEPILHLGPGPRRSAESLNPVIKTVAGNGGGSPPFTPPFFGSDGDPATNFGFSPVTGAAEDSQGNLFVVSHCQITRVDDEGGAHFFAGATSGRTCRDPDASGVPAIGQGMREPHHIAIDHDDNVYFISVRFRSNDVIRKIEASTGLIFTVAGGTGPEGFSGDGGPATAAQFKSPQGMEFDSEGNMYIADSGNGRIRKIDKITGIITTVAGGGGNTSDGVLATNAKLSSPEDITFDKDGNMYIAEASEHKVRKVDAITGIITTVAGDGSPVTGTNPPIDGVPATQSPLRFVHSVDFDNQGNLIIATRYRLRRVDRDGIIHTIAGREGNNLFPFNGDDIPAHRALLNLVVQVDVGNSGSINLAVYSHIRVRQISPGIPGFGEGNILLVSEDGSEVFVFNNTGRHLQTLNAITGATVYSFAYSASGKLVSITDGDNNVTTIQRDVDGNPTSITSTDGQQTLLALNSDGYITGITNPNNETDTFSYTPEGLMLSMTDARTNTSLFSYDASGKLTRDEDAAGGSQTFARSGQDDNFVITRTTGLNRVSSFGVQQLLAGGNLRTVTDPNGLATTTFTAEDDNQTITSPDGTVTTVTKNPDPRFGMQAALSNLNVATPGGLTSTLTTSRSVVLTDPLDLFSMTSMVDTLILNGRAISSIYDKSQNKMTNISPEGRQFENIFDDQGRVTKEIIPGITDRSFEPDLRGRLAAIRQGTGANERVSTITYNPQGFVASINDPLGRINRFEYDTSGRVTKQVLPDSREILTTYDANGNVAAITPPGRPAHVFEYTPVNLESAYTPPDVGLPVHATRFTYNLDKQLSLITRPDGKTVLINYDTGGRRSEVRIPRGNFSYGYDLTTGQLKSIQAPDGGTLSFIHDGRFRLSSTWVGTVAGSVTRTFNTDHQVASRSINGGHTINFTYDGDELITQAGDLSLQYSTSNTFLTGTTLGVVADSLTYTAFGELGSYTATANGNQVYSQSLVYDQLGRVVEDTQTVLGVTNVFTYVYEIGERLSQVRRDGVLISQYNYDLNGNRVGGTVDDQDRLISFGTATYTYTANGELATKTDPSGVTTYNYDVLGNLLSVTLPSGNLIEYVYDGQNRRIGKKVDGILEKGWLYKDGYNPVAELDGSGNVVSRFVYGTRNTIPAFMIKNGNTYRIVSDRLGSPRLVIDTATGLVAQQMDHDEWGNVIADTSPGFQPFGYAGGLYDEDTQLVQFGARDYDPNTGRWTAKDPIRFRGNDTNLYNYVLSDPINLIDPLGLYGTQSCKLYDDLSKRYPDSDYFDSIAPFVCSNAPKGEANEDFGKRSIPNLSNCVRQCLQERAILRETCTLVGNTKLAITEDHFSCFAGCALNPENPYNSKGPDLPDRDPRLP